MRKNTIFAVTMLLLTLSLLFSEPMKETTIARASATQGANAQSEAQEILIRNDEKKTNDKAANWPTKYKIFTETYIAYTDTMDIAIRYPQIIGLGDEERQNRINELIRREAIPEQFVNYPGKRLFTLPIDYKITLQSDKLLSIQYSGVGYVKGEPHPNHFFYTSNIDFVQVKKIKLKDLVRIDVNFVDKFRSANIKTVSPHPGALTGKQIFIDYTSFNTIADTIRKFNDADELDPKGLLQGYYCYFTQNSLGISAATPHAVGDHAEFEIKYEDIAENIKADNEVWRDFFPSTGKQ